VRLPLSRVLTGQSPGTIVPTVQRRIELNYCHFPIIGIRERPVLRKPALLLLMGLLVPLQWAQTTGTVQQAMSGDNLAAGAGSEDGIITIRRSVEEVNVIFTATDKRGRFKKNLKSSDFAVYDDGKPPAAVRSFRSETDLPLRVGLVLDVSGSITSRFAFEQEAATRFFTQVIRPNTDQAFVMTFNSVPTLARDFTDDPQLLASGVEKLAPGGGSAVYDALYAAAIEKLMGTHADRPVRRIIILISDGEDNQSRVTVPEVIEAARRAEVSIYAISTSNSNIFSRGDRLMEKFAEDTGGRAFFPSKIEDVVRAFNTIQEELRSQYALSYKPANFDADGHYRCIDIQARTDKNLVIRARKGYFAPNR
jgi:Ca-activated chloride channel family protein